jgi:hypothetical protein
MENYFEVNVSLNGKHLFATAPRSARSAFELKRLLKVLRQQFPYKEGFEVTCTKWESSGTVVDVELASK